MKTLIVVLLVAFVAAEQKREAEPSYGVVSYGHGHGYGVGHHYGHGYGYGPAVAHHPYGGHSYVSGHLIGKRDAEPSYGYPTYGLGYGHGYGHGIAYGIGHGYGYGHAIAHRPYHGHSYVSGHHVGKRDAEPSYGYPVYGLGHGHHGHGAAYGYTTSVQHPGYGHSYVQYNQGVVPARYGYY